MSGHKLDRFLLLYNIPGYLLLDKHLFVYSLELV